MDYAALAELLYPNITETPEDLERRFPPRELPEGAVVSRAAPSPTGYVHLGNIVQALTSERMAHQSGGVMFLRIEDTDQKREKKGAVEELITGLAEYGVIFDEGATANGDSGNYGPYRQRARAPIYHVYAKKLVCEGKAYPCFCTAEELNAIRKKQKGRKENFGYYGSYALWRDRPLEDIQSELAKGTPWVLRFRSEGTAANKIKVTDLIKGELELPENDIDHVLLKSDGIPTYHFARSVDDHLMRTTHVVRGDEWLPSLPYHLQLDGALGLKPPKYAHIGALQKMDGSSKRKLSKRKDPELALSYYRAQGYPRQSVYEYILGVLNSNFEDWRRANPELPARDFQFSVKKMNPAGSLFDMDKLRDVSKNVLAAMTANEVFDGLADWSAEFDPEFHALLTADADYALAVLSIGRGSPKPRKDLALYSEARGLYSFFWDELFTPDYTFPERERQRLFREIVAQYIDMYDHSLDGAAWFDSLKPLAVSFGFAPETKIYRQNPEAYKGSVGDIAQFIRIAVTGREQSPDLWSCMQVLGEGRVLERLKLAAGK